MNEAYIFFTVIYGVVIVAILSLFARDLTKWLKSRRTKRAADFACTCEKFEDFTALTNPACPVHGRASPNR